MGYRRVPKDKTLEQWIRGLESRNQIRCFYQTKEWHSLRDEVMHEAHNKCEDCLAKTPAVLTQASQVHHVCEVSDRPDLALSKTYTDAAGMTHKNLVALCHDCHDVRHGRFVNNKGNRRKRDYVTVEMFD